MDKKIEIDLANHFNDDKVRTLKKLDRDEYEKYLNKCIKNKSSTCYINDEFGNRTTLIYNKYKNHMYFFQENKIIFLYF